MEGPIIEARNISKIIDGQTILKRVSFCLQGNKAFFIRGRNGSGKSTLLKLLAGIYQPTHGALNRGTNRIGYMPEHFPEGLPFRVKEYLSMVADFHGHSKNELKAYIQLFSIEAFLNTSLKQCSKGTKQKVGIIQALISKPDILLLDEPLTGLDQKSQQVLTQLLEKQKRNSMIIFTAHENPLIEKLADEHYHLEAGGFAKSNIKSRKKQIKFKYTSVDILQNLQVVTHNRNEKTAILSANSDQSDPLLLHLLNNQCSILEVWEEGER
ncbi:ABC transporter ATP-binding protein [Bacillus sp. J14TS2]|uniref:ATP-binding cassette domain-containing protein n=1 Tax=Bacillus sp. J14TS2 TaxID=2807188 RepID=UPI001B279A96|nr:ABC transporter ATP-binding protein [Bacillus sp. J14TS2]GIN70233.1 ABC transporter ATP-binding protein [Bacillus sp. J14TS2]